mmetsp:Transcript_13097/g.19311  ORF Transcript_13097/g.19311 Transcript_13097/m.19311 type:complete len:80 (-) Transcript_13097:31-270(-)
MTPRLWTFAAMTSSNYEKNRGSLVRSNTVGVFTGRNDSSGESQCEIGRCYGYSTLTGVEVLTAKFSRIALGHGILTLRR